MARGQFNNEEKKWIRAILDIGCIVCHRNGFQTPAEVHHLKSGGVRIGHSHSIPLCMIHHRSGRNDDDAVSRHPWKKQFEIMYGKEDDLYEYTKSLIELRD